MSRLQLALNVSDLDAAVAFYSSLFGTAPAKHYAGYANFAIADPPLKLVLIENEKAAERLNHLGVEVFGTHQVADEYARLTAAGLPARADGEVTCCYAVQDKFWVDGPDSTPWEVYTVLAPADTMGSSAADACCAGDQPSCCAA